MQRPMPQPGQPGQPSVEQQIARAKEVQKNLEIQRFRGAALVMAEYNYKDDPEVSSRVAELAATSQRMERLSMDFQAAESRMSKIREDLERVLEAYIPEELRLLTAKDKKEE